MGLRTKRAREFLRKIGIVLAGSALGLLGTGCFERTLRPINPCTRSRFGETIRVQNVDEVDLLFMVDNSNSMAEEQESLTEQLPRLVRILASGDRNGDGQLDFTPVRSLHIGIVSSDMGTAGFNVPTCTGGTFGARFGDDGVLLNRSRCSGTFPRIFEFMRGGDADAFARDVACVATLGTGGCGFEQQLEAVLKALSPSTPQPWTIDGYVPPVFFDNTYGHADRENRGFVRENSALAIILLSDEEDCSAADPDVYNPMSPRYGGTDPNLRCFMFPTVAHPVERYVRGVDGRSGLLGLRRNPNLLIFAGIVGVPVESVPDPENVDYDAILRHPLMQEEIDPTMPTRLRPSCNVPRRGIAFPPRRIVEVAKGIQAAGGQATIQSICQADYSGALTAIIKLIANALGGACLPRDLNPDPEGFVACNVFEILPATGPRTHCAGLPGRTLSGPEVVDGVERERCAVEQVGPGRGAAGEAGWYYEQAEATPPGSDIRRTCGDTGQRIRFTMDPVPNSIIRLECLQTIQSGGGGRATVGTFCDPGMDICGGGSTPSGEGTLDCDPAERECRVPCTTDADCTRAGLLGDVCDTRPWREVVTDERQRMNIVPFIPGGNLDAPHHFCVNPTCI
jgi:hypothetical protein